MFNLEFIHFLVHFQGLLPELLGIAFQLHLALESVHDFIQVASAEA